LKKGTGSELIADHRPAIIHDQLHFVDDRLHHLSQSLVGRGMNDQERLPIGQIHPVIGLGAPHRFPGGDVGLADLTLATVGP
jgi:hypothetical protein